jgi:hypothetical protein
MLDRIVNGVDAGVRGVIYIALVVCGAAMAILAAAVVSVGAYRVWEFIWKNFYSFSWGQ